MRRSSQNNSSNGTNDASPPATNNSTNTEASTNGNENANAKDTNAKDADTTTDVPKKGLKEFWENNKKWIKPVGIGVTTLSVLYWGFKAWRKKQAEKSAVAKTPQAALNGVGRKRKRKKGKAKSGHRKDIKALM